MQSKILVDTNSYLRLAKSIHPLLCTPFGEKKYCLYILPELNKELTNTRFENKFPWIWNIEYTENRQYFPNISNKQKKQIKQTHEYVWDYVQTDLPGPSRIDALYIAHSIELQIPVVTDDQDMNELARSFDAQALSTLELLRIMLDCGHIEMKIITSLCDYWRYSGDVPANLDIDFAKLFSG